MRPIVQLWDTERCINRLIEYIALLPKYSFFKQEKTVYGLAYLTEHDYMIATWSETIMNLTYFKNSFLKTYSMLSQAARTGQTGQSEVIP